MDKFLEIYGALPRAGPGSNGLTRRAFRAISTNIAAPVILDVGCGPGMQTLELLRLGAGHVTALDLLPQMIERLQAAALAHGLADGLTTLEQDMHAMAFPADTFDIVWSEGAIYILGFEAGLQAFKPIVKPGGYIAVSEVVWLKEDPPAAALEMWSEYPEIDTLAGKRAVIDRVGLELVDEFVFPAHAWTEAYYDPMETRIAAKSKDWADDPEGQAILSGARNEIAVFRECSDYYSYAFFIMRKPSEARSGRAAYCRDAGATNLKHP